MWRKKMIFNIMLVFKDHFEIVCKVLFQSHWARKYLFNKSEQHKEFSWCLNSPSSLYIILSIYSQVYVKGSKFCLLLLLTIWFKVFEHNRITPISVYSFNDAPFSVLIFFIPWLWKLICSVSSSLSFFKTYNICVVLKIFK